MSKKKKIQKFEKALDKLVAKKEIVKIYRFLTEGEANIDGVIINNPKGFLHVAETDDFEIVGEVIIPKDQFESIRCNEYDKAYKKIMKKEGRLKVEKSKGKAIDYSNWASILKDLKRKDIHVIVECEDLKKASFDIGPVVKVKKKTVELRNYDATGQLENKTTQIKFKDITSLRFNDKYSKTFRKYLKEPKAKKKK